MSSEEARRLFTDRARIVSAVRAYLDGEGFLEVETPVLQPIYGGALARPFTTHHNALDRTLYLRIATELYLKRCIVGGLERVYELGKDFRNEGVSTKHNPEFTMVEWYEAYADYNDAALRLEALVRAAARSVGARRSLDLARPWRRVSFVEAIHEAIGVDVMAHPDAPSLAAALAAQGLPAPTPQASWPQLADELLSTYVEPELLEPTFVFDYPVGALALRPRAPLQAGPRRALGGVLGGIEIANAFSELDRPRRPARAL